MRSLHPLHMLSATAIALSLSLSGCAQQSQFGPQITAVHYYPACYQPMNDLRRDEQAKFQKTAGWTVGGAALGALIGALAAANGKKSNKDIIISSAIGGMAGAGVGFLYGRQQGIADENKRMYSYMSELEGDISNLDMVSAASRMSLQCYDRNFDALIQDIKTGHVARFEAQQRFREIRDGRTEAGAILGVMANYGNKMDDEYENAFRQEKAAFAESERKAPAKVNRVKRDEAKKTLARAEKRKTVMKKKVEDISKEKDAAAAKNRADLEALDRALAQSTV